MDIVTALQETILTVQEEFNKLFVENGIRREKLGKFGKIFYDEFDSYMLDGGKRIRPFLVLTAFEAVNGDHKEGNITRASLAIELLHNGSLLHDDVIDRDETRRGKPSFHIRFRDIYTKMSNESNEKAALFGEAMSIFAGDLCFPFAIESIINSGFPEERKILALRAFTEAFREVLDGVILEIGDTMKAEISEERYMYMIHLKTGALIRKAAEIGAILGGGTKSQREALMNYCTKIGVAFQIQDDILGVFGNPQKLGKPVGGDIREAKQTILRIKTFKLASSGQKKELQKLIGKEELTEKELEIARKIMKESGGLAGAKALAQQTLTEAIAALEQAEPPLNPKAKAKFVALIEFLKERET